MPSGGNHNPSGRNQHEPILSAEDPALRSALQSLHRQGYSSNQKISDLLLAEYGIKCGPWTVKDRRKRLGLSGSRKTTAEMPVIDSTQLIIGALEDDPQQSRGPQTIKHHIASERGVHLSRNYVRDVMRDHAPEGFHHRKPDGKKIHRSVLTSLGPDDEWSGDGHDKLKSIGIEIYGIRDKASGMWLGLWVVPSNRIKEVVACLYLMLIEERGGIPIKTITDCGSETTLQFGFARALQERFYPEDTEAGLEPHVFLRSTHNTVIESGWLYFKTKYGDNIHTFFNKGISRGIYNINSLAHYKLAQWMWSTLLQREFPKYREQMNSYRGRKVHGKILPSGASPKEVYMLPGRFNLIHCLRPVDPEVVRDAREAIGGQELLEFVPQEYAAHAIQVLNQYGGLSALSLHNIWDVFRSMLPHMQDL